MQKKKPTIKKSFAAETALDFSTLKKFFDDAGIGLAVVNSKNKLVSCNRALKMMLGYTKKELESLSAKDLTLPADYEKEKEIYKREILKDGRSAYRIEKRLRHKNGKFIWSSITASVVRNKKGEIIYGIGIVEDISERKIIEKDLLESEERFRVVTEMVSDYAYSYQVKKDGSLKREWITDAASRITGYSMDELMAQKNWTEIVIEEDVALSKEKLQETLDGNPVEYDVRIKTKRGDIRELRDHTYPVWDGKKRRVVHLYGAVTDVTEQNKTARQLFESRAFIQQILDASPNLIYIQNVQSGANYFSNKECERFYGLSNEEIKKQGATFFNDRVHPDDIHHFQSFLEFWKTANESSVWENDFRMKNARGEYRWLRSRDTIFKRDSEGKVELILGTAIDVTERRKAREKLRQSEERYRQLFELAPIGVGIKQYGGKYLDVNPALCEFLGYSKEELLTMTVADVSHPDDMSESIEAYDRLLEGKETHVKIHKRYKRKDGREAVGELHLRLLKPKIGEAPKFMGQVIDITEAHQANIKLEESERRFRLLIQNSSDITAIMNREGILTYISPSIQNVLGYAAEELINKSAFEHVHPDDLARARDVFEKAIDEVPQNRFECRFKHKEGEWKIIEVTVNRALDEPTIRGIILNVRDITERKQVERQLLQSQKMEAIGSLAGGMAHDFNNIMASILVAAQLVKESPNGDKIIERMQMIERAVKRGKGIVENLLFFAREKTPEMKPISCMSIISQIAEMIEHSFPRDIVIEVDCPEDSMIMGDVDQLYQALLNLAINARDAMPKGGALKLSSSICSLNAEGDVVRIQVADTGSGIPKEVQARMFEPFFTTKEVGKGTGLGLAIVHGVMKAHQGKIGLESIVGKGTTFSLYFPNLAKNLTETLSDSHRA
jgi:PAS domain S-box-containing protein